MRRLTTASGRRMRGWVNTVKPFVSIARLRNWEEDDRILLDRPWGGVYEAQPSTTRLRGGFLEVSGDRSGFLSRAGRTGRGQRRESSGFRPGRKHRSRSFEEAEGTGVEEGRRRLAWLRRIGSYPTHRHHIFPRAALAPPDKSSLPKIQTTDDPPGARARSVIAAAGYGISLLAD